MLIANGSTEEEISAFAEAYDRIGALETRVPYLPGTSVPGYGDVDTIIAESGVGDEWGEIRTKYIVGDVDRDTLVNFINTRIVPTYQPMEDLFANYNDGQDFNK